MIDLISEKNKRIKELEKENDELYKKIEELGKKNHCGDGYYKIVAKAPFSKDYFSICAYGESRVDYKIGEWVSAPKWLFDSSHHLLCFNILFEAKTFAMMNGGYLFKCEIEERVDLPRLCNCDMLAEGKIQDETLNYFQKGTIAAKRVKLVGEEINYILP